MKHLTILLPFVLAVCFLFTNCDNDENNCKAVTNQDCVCIEIWEPVCGCDGKTYSNSCHANCANITNYEEGECD